MTSGSRGIWTKLDIGRIDEGKLADPIRPAWRGVAPKKLIAGEGA